MGGNYVTLKKTFLWLNWISETTFLVGILQWYCEDQDNIFKQVAQMQKKTLPHQTAMPSQTKEEPGQQM